MRSFLHFGRDLNIWISIWRHVCDESKQNCIIANTIFVKINRMWIKYYPYNCHIYYLATVKVVNVINLFLNLCFCKSSMVLEIKYLCTYSIFSWTMPVIIVFLFNAVNYVTKVKHITWQQFHGFFQRWRSLLKEKKYKTGNTVHVAVIYFCQQNSK